MWHCPSGVPFWAPQRAWEEEKASYRFRVRTETSEETRVCCEESKTTRGAEETTGRTKS